MNCERFEALIALQVEGDLSGRDAERLEEHLRECSTCRDLHGALSESQAALKDLGTEAADSEALDRVRRRVMAEVTEKRPSLVYAWRWKYALAAGAVLVILGVVLSEWGTVTRPPAPLVVQAPPAAPEVVAKKVPQPARMPARQARKRAPLVAVKSRIEPPKESEPLVVKLVTDDPNVVIVWLIDRTGD